MKICRFELKQTKEIKYGVFVDGKIRSLSADIFSGEKLLPTETSYSTHELKILTPIAPSKIVCIGRNYADHARELGNEVPTEPLLFLKAPSSLITDNEKIVIPPQSQQVEHEGELAAVIRRKVKNLTENDDPFDYVLGFAPLNDITARDLQRRDVQFTRAKSFDTFCPIGNYIETELNTNALDVTVKVNGLIKQHGNTNQMVFSVAALIRYVSNQMTLLPGDIIATGTPAGVSKLNPGDLVEVQIEGLETLRNPVVQG